MEKRNLVGRRYEDFLKNGIYIQLTGEERLWQALFADPRFHALIERRKSARRKSDETAGVPIEIFQGQSSVFWMAEAGVDIRY